MVDPKEPEVVAMRIAGTVARQSIEAVAPNMATSAPGLRDALIQAISSVDVEALIQRRMIICITVARVE